MPSSAPRWLPRSLRAYLLLLTLVTVLPAAVLSVYVAYQAYDRERDAVEARLLETSRAFSLAVDRQLGQAEAVLRTLAAAPALARADYAAFYRLATAARLDQATAIALVGADGRLIFATGVPYGTPLPPIPTVPELEERLRDHDLFVSNLIWSPVYDSLIVLVALRLGPPGTATPRLVMSLPPESLNGIIREQQLPGGWNIAILDRVGTVIARSRQPERFVGGPATERARAAIRTGTEGVFRSRALDDIESVGAFSRLRGTGWTVVLSAPLAEVAVPAERLLLTTGAIALLLLTGGIAVALLIGRIVVRAMAALTAEARAVGRGEIPPPPAIGISDIHLVAETLRDSAQRLKRGEEELRRLNETLETRVQEATERLVAASKLEAIGRLTGGIAHDFNNLLAAIRINLDLITRHFPAPKSLEFAKAARDSSDRGAKLVAQLLAFGRQQRLTPEPVDDNAVADAMAQMLRTTLTGIELKVELAAELPAALSDRTQLEMIIMNLAINARDAMPAGGAIVLATARARVESPPARPEAPAPGDYVVVAVTDTGSGMSEELLGRVFEPFFTTKGVGKGSGLGLPQVLGIVKQLGGGIRIDSEPGRGTEVRVFLPVATEAAAVREAPAAGTGPARLDGLRVLLVDDDAGVRQPAAALLEALGCRVATAEDGPAALALLEADEEPDLVLADYAMPGMTGIELADRLAARPDAPPVVLMTGFADAAQLGARWRGPLLQKPFSQEALAQALVAMRLGTRADGGRSG